MKFKCGSRVIGKKGSFFEHMPLIVTGVRGDREYNFETKDWVLSNCVYAVSYVINDKVYETQLSEEELI